MPTKGLDFPRGLTLARAVDFISKGDRQGLIAWLIAEFGAAAGDPLTVENFIELLAMFGFTGPLSNYLPPVCGPVTHTNLIVVIPAGTTESVGLPGCGVEGGVRKYRSIVVSPINRTAEDNVIVKQTIRAPALYVKLFSNPSCGFRPGNFSTFENICVPCDGCVLFDFRSTNANSEARVHLEAESWVT